MKLPSRVLGFAALWGVASCCNAATLAVTIVDRDGKPVPEVAVVATPAAGSPVNPAPAAAAPMATMDQINLQFEPQILIVRKGTVVSFPNSDDVAHQVYSFSPAKHFALPLYRGQASAPVTFEQSGLVILGCNIHDSMIGYVYVADSPYYGKTDSRGRIDLNDLPAGTYRVTAWNPRFTEPNPELATEVTVAADTARSEFKLTQALAPAPQISSSKKLRY